MIQSFAFKHKTLYTVLITRFLALLGLTTVAVTVAATPIVIRNSPVTLPIASRVNTTGVPSILKQDQARAKTLKARSQAQGKSASLKQAALFDVDATNQAVDYVVSVGVGTPPTTYSLLVDTGSSNTWVGADKTNNPWKVTNSSIDTGEAVVSYYRIQ